MSLLVEVFVREPDGDMRILDVPDEVYQSGGFESWRTTVWGSEFVRSPGARFLPVPAGQDLCVEPGDVPEFQREVALLRSRLDDVARGTERPRTVEEHRHQIDTRLRIIEESARKALEMGGGVLIWWPGATGTCCETGAAAPPPARGGAGPGAADGYEERAAGT
jgi:hypothetical protein